MPDNLLYYGDNLPILRQHMEDDSVDLVYLDPPFNSNADYNVLFAEQDGSRAAAQIKAFGDTWEWSMEAEAAYLEVVEKGGPVSLVMQAFRTFLGTSNLMAYLAMMAPRLVELRRVLKSTGSIYLHCDPTASHYLKTLMDAVFGPVNFLNEIIWKRTTAHSSAKKYAPIHDVLLYYGKANNPIWNSPRTGYDQAYLDKYYRFDDGDGRLYWRADLTGAGIRHGSSGLPWHDIDPSAIGRHWMFPIEQLDALDAEGRIYWPKSGKPQFKRYREDLKGKAVPDIWDDINRINPVGSERLHYPTQKPEALLERIIASSSHPGDVVLDPFCGCGTAIAAAQKLGRRWIGIDITHLAITLIRHRLFSAFGKEIVKQYKVIGEPVSVPDAQELASQKDRYPFQWWALGLIGARPVPSDQKKGADQGIDGRLYFHDEGGTGKTKQIVISVKSGHVNASHIRDLRGVMDREKAAIGVLLTMEEPSQPMTVEAASAGFYESPWGSKKHPRLQILTVAELLDGKGIDMPPIHQTNVTFKRGRKAKAKGEEHHPVDLLDAPAEEE